MLGMGFDTYEDLEIADVLQANECGYHFECGDGHVNLVTFDGDLYATNSRELQARRKVGE